MSSAATLELQQPRTVSTLLSDDSFNSTDETLEKCVQRNSSVSFFLRLTGVIWASDDSLLLTAFQYFWNILIRVCVAMMIMFAIITPVEDDFLPGSNYDLDAKLFFVLLGFTMAAQSIVLLLAFRDIHGRIKLTINRIFALNLPKGVAISYLVLVISLIVSVVPFVVEMLLYEVRYVLFAISEAGISLVLGATMYFISLDCAVATSLLDQLSEQQKLQLLTFDQYSSVRDEIKSRQQSSAWINNAIVSVALLDMSTVLIFVLLGNFDGNYCIIMLGIFFKEFPFLAAVYWQVAQVNEKSCLFLKQLSICRWSSESNTDQERVAIYVNAQGNPIVMSLAGMKLKRKDLAWQLALWCFAFVLSIVKTALADKF